MLPKPDACRGCPYWQTGQGFVPDAPKPGAPLLVLMQNPGEHEETGQRVVGYAQRHAMTEPVAPQPLIGPTGWAMDQHYLPLTGFTRDQVSVANVIKCRWQGRNALPKGQVTEAAALHCWRAHFKLPEGTKVILAAGNLSKWAATGEGTSDSGIEDWRGYAAKYAPVADHAQTVRSHIWTPGPGDIPVLMSIHLANLFERPIWKTPTRKDWAKVADVLAGRWPKPLPRIERTIPEGFWRDGVAFDTEYNPSTNTLLRYSAYDGDRLVVVEAEDHDPSVVPEAPVALVYQNAYADWKHAQALGLTLKEWDIRDTMLRHAVLWSGFPHDLNFLGSLYARLNRWKDLSGFSLREYAGGDAVGTWDAEQALVREMVKDPMSKLVYDRYVSRVPLINLRRRPLLVDRTRVETVLADLDTKLAELRLRAQAHVGWPINLGSADHVRFWLYGIELVHMTARRLVTRPS